MWAMQVAAPLLSHPPSALRFAGDQRALLLRPVQVADAPAIAAAISDSLPELRAFMPWAHLPQLDTESQYRRLAQLQNDYWLGRDHHLALLDETEGTLLGCFGLHPRALNPRALELGYWMWTPVTGRGLATLSARCLAILGFDYLGLERVQCGHDAANDASRRVVEKVGFQLEGKLRHFDVAPTEQSRAAGDRRSGVNLLYGLVRADLPALPWVPALRRQLQVFDWRGQPVPPPA
jgi:RimJ/RimL family protein N-acetyltransferase